MGGCEFGSGPATGDRLDIVSLGDLDQSQIGAGIEPGQITVTFTEPVSDGVGYDFAIFENGLVSNANYSTGSVTGQMFAELGYVEVSSNGVDFVRFPSVSLTTERVGLMGQSRSATFTTWLANTPMEMALVQGRLSICSISHATSLCRMELSISMT